jgi:hypothetical protein
MEKYIVWYLFVYFLLYVYSEVTLYKLIHMGN